jgi:hypothetical protein
MSSKKQQKAKQNRPPENPLVAEAGGLFANPALWLMAGILLLLTGYFGPWIDHEVAGLVVTGLDLGEYVKFLPEVRSGAIPLWREGFYLPLVAASLICSLMAFRPELHYRLAPLRILLLVTAVVASLNLLPPAWTPARMLTSEFQQQLIALIVTMIAMAVSPLLALLPLRLAAVLCGLLALSCFVAVSQFFAILPAVEPLYHQPLGAGWGLWTMVVGVLALVATAVRLAVWPPPAGTGTLR